jgi:ParB family chromosome partitioning protein
MKKALGKGLGSLIPEKSGNEVKEVKLANITPNKYQMRTNFNHDKILEMSESIKENGIVQPVVVTRNGNKYMLIAGERRWRAAKMAGMSSIPCIEKELNDKEILTVSLIENVQREDISPLEEATAYDRMMKEFSMTQQEIADKVGKSRSAVANTVRILSLPEDLRDLIDREEITAGHARAILSVKNPAKRRALAEKIVKEKLTVREAEKLAAMASGKTSSVKSKKKISSASSEIKEFSEKFEKRLGTKVNIKLNKNNSGTISIEFYTLDDFDRISGLICKK